MAMAARRSSKRKETARVRPRRLSASWAIAAVAVALVAGAALIGISMATRSSDEEVSGTSATGVATQHLCASGSVPAEGRICGQDSAPVKIVELSDYQCPFCKRFVDLTEPQIESEYIQKGLVQLEFRNFAVTGGNASPDENEATLAAEAAECANDQGRFWEYHYKLYAEQAGENRGAFLPDRLKQFASDLGLDREEFDACLDSHKHIDLVEQQRDEAVDLGAQGTPSFLINGELVVGFMTFDEFSQHIEEALTKQ
jgi:protein-disulfide isomerase